MLGSPQSPVGALRRLGFAIGVACATASALAGPAAAGPNASLHVAAPTRAQDGAAVLVRTRLSAGVRRHALEYRVDGVLVGRRQAKWPNASWMVPTESLKRGRHRLTVSALYVVRGRKRKNVASRSLYVGISRPTVKAENVGQPAPTAPGVPAPADQTPPSRPSGLAVHSAQGPTAEVRWNASTDDTGVSGYRILLSGSVVGTTTATQFTLSGLRCEWRHSLVIEAFDAAGNRAASGALPFESGSCLTPSGVPMPSTDLPGWKLVFSENFLVDAPKGSWGSDFDPAKVVYTGARGTRWVTYPRSYVDTYDRRPYRSDEVLSVHHGVLDFHLRDVDGQPAGANPSPILSTGSQYQTYGRYSARMKVDNADLAGYYVAWLLWPELEADWESAESDFPEGPLLPGASPLMGVSHFGPNKQQEVFLTTGFDPHDWHTYTQEWAPGVRRYYVDDQLLFTTTTPIYNKPQRWQLQTETKGDAGGNGHLEIDWAAVWSYAP